ncbi:MAG: decaprenyl-phosphate phosphoribosyltransferase [bacterium]|nr:decaprenyl-phosphate phosphoribosyltransferase [bacterium]
MGNDSVVINVVKSLRPKQWIKNLLVFAGLVFSQNLFNLEAFLTTICAFFIFCLVSGSIYILNDIVDLPFDRANPLKAKRPLASGKLKITHAKLAVFILAPIALLFAYLLDYQFLLVVLLYIILQVFYSFYLKNIPIIDILVIALGSILRVIGGAIVINVTISSWLLICTILLALLLALSKRRYELVVFDEEARNKRNVLGEYNTYLLDQMISVVTSSVLIAYSLYTMSEETVERFGTRSLIFTVPFVLYGLFRFLYLIYRKDLGDSPEGLLLLDKPLLIDVSLWILTVLILIYLL